MTRLEIEQLGTPASKHDARVVAFERERAADELAGRTVWCAVATSSGRTRAEAFRACLQSDAEDRLDSGWIELDAGELLTGLTQRLDTMLRGIAARSAATGLADALGAADDEVFADGTGRGDWIVGDDVHAGDVVVLHDPIAPALSQAVRARGAHVVWRVSIGRPRASAFEAWRFLHRRAPALDAYITAWPGPVDRGSSGLAAFMSSPDVICAKELGHRRSRDAQDDGLSWRSLLADVVEADHEERVGGTLHPRPTVAAR